VIKNLKKMLVSALTPQMREFRLKRDSMCALSVGKPLVRVQTSQCMNESTQERSPISVRSVEKPSVIAPTLWFIRESTLG
jgi:hypothetical protein